MVALSLQDKSRTRFHLGYTIATPAVDRGALEKSMDFVADDWTVTQIVSILDRCDQMFSQYIVPAYGLDFGTRVGVSGDVVRTTETYEAVTKLEENRIYLGLTSLLAKTLGVRNMRDPSDTHDSYLVNGGVYINSVPGVQGSRGTIWWSKAGVPVVDEFGEIVDDYCIDTLTGDYYVRVAFAWVFVSSLRGPVGFASVPAKYTFNVLLFSPPALGFIRFNSSDLSLVTELYVSNVGVDSVDFTSYLDSLTFHSLISIYDVQSPSTFILFRFDDQTPAAQSSRTITGNSVAYNGMFSDAATLAFFISVRGVDGSIGSGFAGIDGGDWDSDPAGVEGFNGGVWTPS